MLPILLQNINPPCLHTFGGTFNFSHHISIFTLKYSGSQPLLHKLQIWSNHNIMEHFTVVSIQFLC